MNKQELIREYESIVKDDSLDLCGCYNKADKVFMKRIYKSVLEDLKQLDEPQKVTVPQFVADWYEEYKDNLEYNIWDWMKYNLEPKKRENAQFSKWIASTKKHPVETLIRMKLYGYTVEKEKRYTVKMKGTDKEFTMFKLDKIRGSLYFGNDTEYSYTKTTHTRKELEEAGFGWVFDYPGMEVEEVAE